MSLSGKEGTRDSCVPELFEQLFFSMEIYDFTSEAARIQTFAQIQQMALGPSDSEAVDQVNYGDLSAIFIF